MAVSTCEGFPEPAAAPAATAVLAHKAVFVDITDFEEVRGDALRQEEGAAIVEVDPVLPGVEGLDGHHRILLCDAPPVGVDHHMRDVARVRCANHGDDLWVDGGFSARKLYHFGVAFGSDKVIQNAFDLRQRQVEARTCVGKTQRAIHVTGAVDFDDSQAGVLLMIRAKSAVVRATIFDLGGKF